MTLDFDRKRGIIFPILTLLVIISVNKPDRAGLIYLKAKREIIKSAKANYGINISLSNNEIWCEDAVRIRGNKPLDRLALDKKKLIRLILRLVWPIPEAMIY